MSVTLTVSDKTFQKLTTTAKLTGKQNVEQLLGEWNGTVNGAPEHDTTERRVVVQKIKAFRKKMFEKYGTMSDSTEIIREDRNR